MEHAEELGVGDRKLVASYWWQRAHGEMTSWVGWRHVLADLRIEGSPEPVIALAEQAVEDELQHALWCRDWAMRFGHPGGEIAPRGERPLALDGASEGENRLVRIAFSCFTETVGCFTLQHARSALRDPELRKLNQRHLSDELVHSRAGWAHLSTLRGAQRDFVRRIVPRLLELLERVCVLGDEQDRADLVPYGYFTSGLLRDAFEEAVESVILTGLRHHGFEGAA